ncbi:MAG TPA: GNVR domain-containing protein [Burkholderiales bacterium]|nr:GNVR domain-containing protein [Burkholderiales bacterium]
MSLGQFFAVLRARAALVLLVALIVTVVVAAMTALMPARYLAAASVMVDTRAALPNGAAPPRPEDVMSTQIDIIASPAVALKVVAALGLEDRPDIGSLTAESRPLQWITGMIAARLPKENLEQPPDRKDWIAHRLLRNLRVKSNRDSQLIRLSYAAPDPEFAAAVANAFVDAYLATVVSLRVEPAQEASRQVEEQVQALRGELERAEAKLSKFQQEKGITATDERLDMETGRLTELSAQLAVAEGQSYESEARQRQLRDFLYSGSSSHAPSEVWASPLLQQLKQGVAEREAKLGELSKRIGPNHPQYQSAALELERMRARLNEEARSAARAALTSADVAPQRERALRGALEQQRARVLRMKNDRNTLAGLAREVETVRQAHDAAVQRLTQARMAGAGGQAGGTMVDAAVVPTRPVSPDPPLYVALALAAGLALGAGLALTGESANRYLRAERDIVELLGIPVLAVLAPRGVRGGAQFLANPKVHSLPKR